MHSFKIMRTLAYLTFGYVGVAHWAKMASALDIVHPEGNGKGKGYCSTSAFL